MSDRTVRDVLGWLSLAKIAHAGRSLGIDPDTVLWRDCPTCSGSGVRIIMYQSAEMHGPSALPIGCDDCNGTGRIEVNRVMVVPVEVADAVAAIGWPDADTLKALRIGRAVLAMNPPTARNLSPDAMAWLEGYESCRYNALAAGEVEDCTCGFGGFHDDINPRCKRNRVAGEVEG